MHKTPHHFLSLSAALILSTSFLLHGCQTSQSASREGFLGKETLNCKVDSSLYSKPYKGFRNIKDGVEISIQRSENKEVRVLVNSKNIFRKCSDFTARIKNWKQAKNILGHTKIINMSRFIGSELGVCQTVDSGWFFLINKKTAYLAFAGPVELPLSVTGLKCT